MKNLIKALGLSVVVASTVFGFTETREINTSSYTASNDTTKLIIISSVNFPQQGAQTGPNTDFRGVLIGSNTFGGLVTIYDSSGTSTNIVAKIGCDTAKELHYNVRLSSGLTYTTSGCTNGVTILYHVN